MARGFDRNALRPIRRNGDVQVARIRSHALDRASLAPEVADNDPRFRPIVVRDLGNVLGVDVLVARVGHLQRLRQVRPQLEAVHAPVGIALRHLLVEDAAPGGHPLYVARAERTAIAEAVAMFNGAGQHVGDGLDPPMRMPGKTGQVVARVLVPEVIEEQERIELGGIAKTKSAVQLHAGTFHGRRRVDDALDRSQGHVEIPFGRLVGQAGCPVGRDVHK